MVEQLLHAERGRVNKVLKYVGLFILLLAILAVILDLVDWHIRKTTTSVSSYTFTGNTIIFSGMTNGTVDVTAGEPGKVTVVYRLTEGIRKLHVGESVRGGTFTVEESGGCNGKLSLILFGTCTSDYQVEVPASTTVIANSRDASILVDGVSGNHQLETNKGAITVKDASPHAITATTNDGHIVMQLLGSPNKITAHSDDGDVDIRLQHNATAYRTTVTSRSGTAKVDVKTTQQSTQHTITVSSNRGDVSVTY